MAAPDSHHISPEAMEIMKRFPRVFGNGPWPVSRTLMGWGFLCGIGWYPILERLFADMDTICVEDGLEKMEVIQVKEKFGSLRVYVKDGNERIYRRIAEAEEEAFTICENCGGPSDGVLSRQGLHTNVCKNCRQNR